MPMGRRIKWRLPAELDFIIIDYLLTDKPTLASCSLVCSRWLPRSRKHLFHAVTIEPSMRRSPHYLADFLQALKRSGQGNPEWAIGAYIKNVKIIGTSNATPSLTCPLSFLRALLSGLPQLASLWLMDLVVFDDLSQEANVLQSEHARFKLDKLIVSDCIAQAGDLKHFLALNDLSTSSLAAFTFPTVQSLTVNSVTDFDVMGVIYTLLADSPSVKNGHLTRIVLVVWSEEELSVFSDFARIAGPAFREVELRVGTDFIDDLDAFHAWFFSTCTVLGSLVLSIECHVIDSPRMARLNADHTRWTLHAYTQILQDHRDAFPALTVIRFEMSPGGQKMAEALIHAALGGDREQVGHTAQNLTEDAWEDESMWASLEDVLRGFPALAHVELVCTGGDFIREETKAELRGALERRLPRLWRSGVAQLVIMGC